MHSRIDVNNTCQIFEVNGSHGMIVADEQSGAVLHFFDEHGDEVRDYDGVKIVTFDVAEYRTTYGKLDASIDILDIGYWYVTLIGEEDLTVAGDLRYEPPVAEHRQTIAEGMRTYNL